MALFAAATATPATVGDPPSTPGLTGADQPLPLVPSDGTRPLTRPRSSPGPSPGSKRAGKRRAVQPEGLDTMDQDLGDLDDINVEMNQFPELPMSFFASPPPGAPGPYPTGPAGTSLGHMPSLTDPSSPFPMVHPMGLVYGSPMAGLPGAGWPMGSMQTPMPQGYYSQMMPQMPAFMHLMSPMGHPGLSPPTPAPQSIFNVSPCAHRGKPTSEPISAPSLSSRPAQPASTSSVMTSVGTDSLGNTIFTRATPHTPSQSHSFIDSADMEALSSAAGMPDPSAYTFPQQYQVELNKSRHGEKWEEWEKNAVVQFWVGKGSSEERLRTAMSVGQTPRVEDQFPEEWRKLGRLFQGSRTLSAIASQWSLIVDTYHDIIAYAKSDSSDDNDNDATTDNSAFSIIDRAMTMIRGLPMAQKVQRKTKVSDVVACCQDPINGWFALMHTRFQGRPRSEFLVSNTRTPLLSGVSSSKSHGSGSNISRPIPSAPTPPPPPSIGYSTGGSALNPSHLSQSSWVNEEAPADPTPLMPPPAAIEILRESRVVADSAVQLLDSKEDYLRSYALLTRVICLERLMYAQRWYTDHLSKGAHDILNSQATSQQLRAKAEARLEQLFLTRPIMVDYVPLLQRLEDSIRHSGALPDPS